MINNPWLFLAIAIFFEILGTSCLKFSNGLTQIFPTIFTMCSYLMSFAMLAMALKDLEVSVAYAVWSGIGILIISLIGIFYFHESVTIMKLASIMLIVMGVVGLHLSTTNLR